MKVLSAGETGRDMDTYLIVTKSGKSLRLTGQHKVLTGRGWLKVSDMRYNDKILSTEESWRQPYHRSSMVSGICGILSRTVKVRGTTTEPQDPDNELPYFTGTFGSTITGLFLRVCTFIMLTTTLITTTFRIWNVLLCRNMLKGIGRLIDTLGSWSTSKESGPSQKRGTLHPKVAESIKRLGLKRTRISFQRRRIVKIVRMNFFPSHSETETDSAQTNVNQRGEELKDWTILPAYANAVEESTELISIQKERLVVDHVLIITDGSKSKVVYDITVEGLHEYGCQGILVGNCIDASRYALEAVRRTVKNRRDTSDVTPIPSLNYWGKK